MELSTNFLEELIKGCLRSKDVLEICTEHLKEEYLPNSYRLLWKTIYYDYDLSGTTHTIGTLSQKLDHSQETQEILKRIKELNPPNNEAIITQLEDFVKKSKFVLGYNKIGKLYQENDPVQAFEVLTKLSRDIYEFSIKELYFEKVFENFDKRNLQRLVDSESGRKTSQKVPFSIDGLDEDSRGGVDEGDTVLALAQSGAGKSTFLRWVGVGAARRGFRVLHIQAEGTEKECLDAYDATWTGSEVHLIENAQLSSKTLKQVEKAIHNVRSLGGEIYVKSVEQFDSVTLKDVRNWIIDLERVVGKPDVVILDYLELFDPGNGKRYSTNNEGERARRDALGSGLKNLALEFKTRIFSATQASSVDPKDLNNPKFVLTRYNVSEFKNIVKPFSYFITLNQTEDERDKGVMRIYEDKWRKYKGGKTHTIYQALGNGRFYDRKKTLELVYNKPIPSYEVVS